MAKAQMLFKFSITIIMDEWEQYVKFDRLVNCIYITTHCI